MKYGILVAAVILLAACAKDADHKLEGKWQLQQVETNGEVIQADTVYYNFQNLLFMYQVYNPATHSFRFQHGFKTLEDDTVLTLELAEDPSASSTFLPLTDWSSKTRSFTIEKVSGKQLILNSEGKRYLFRRF